MRRKLGWVGAVATTVYLVVLCILVWGRLPKLFEMELNTVGDFLAGAFGPLAILWLVLGFFQQGIELRQNSDALLLQARELQNSVTQQAELASTAKAQFDLDKSALEQRILELNDEKLLRQRMLDPRISISGTQSVISMPKEGRSFPKYIVDVHCKGSNCSELHLSLSIGQENEHPELHRHEVWKAIFDQPIEPHDWPIYAQLTYLTSVQEKWQIDYVVHMNEGKLTFSEFGRSN